MQKERQIILEFVKNKCELKLKELIEFELPRIEIQEIPNYSKKEYLEYAKRAEKIMKSINAVNIDIANQLDQYQNMQKLAKACLEY